MINKAAVKLFYADSYIMINKAAVKLLNSDSFTPNWVTDMKPHVVF